jgi:hypothetical protein
MAIAVMDGMGDGGGGVDMTRQVDVGAVLRGENGKCVRGKWVVDGGRVGRGVVTDRLVLVFRGPTLWLCSDRI